VPLLLLGRKEKKASTWYVPLGGRKGRPAGVNTIEEGGDIDYKKTYFLMNKGKAAGLRQRGRRLPAEKEKRREGKEFMERRIAFHFKKEKA